MRKWLIPTLLLLLVLVGMLVLGRQTDKEETSSTQPAQEVPAGQIEAIADNLEIPWDLAFAQDGRIFLTERPGRVRIIQDGQLQAEPALTVETSQRGEGGLQGLALDPDFGNNHYVYLYVSEGQGNQLTNRIVRYREGNGQLVDATVLVNSIPGNNNHNGGQLEFGPDGKLYATTGDSQEPSLAQDQNSLAGKILRMNPDGSVPPDNPFGSLVWTTGHRNPQGLAWDDQGRLFEVEHGPSGDLGLCCRDELNLIEKGKNYGWPLITGTQTQNGLVSPLLTSGNSDTWAPAGLSFTGGKLYFGALRGTHLHRVDLANGAVTGHQETLPDRGRLRTVVTGPDGWVYVTTSNRDGRGRPQSGDDKLLRLKP